MEVVRREINLKLGQELVIAPIGDIQWSGNRDAIAYQHLVRHLKRCKKLKALYLGMGDYTDFASPSNRQALRNGKLYDTAREVIKEKALQLTYEAYEELLKSTKGEWLGMLTGHHFYPLGNGQSTDRLLAFILDAPYLEVCGLVELSITVCDHEPKSLWIWCHHGNGNGGASAPIRKLESLSPYWDADIMVIGHMTKLAAAPINRIIGGWTTTPELDAQGDVYEPKTMPELTHKRITLVGNGGWSKAYQLGRNDYVEQGLLRPASLGGALIRIWGWIDDNGELQLEHRAEV